MLGQLTRAFLPSLHHVLDLLCCMPPPLCPRTHHVHRIRPRRDWRAGAPPQQPRRLLARPAQGAARAAAAGAHHAQHVGLLHPALAGRPRGRADRLGGGGAGRPEAVGASGCAGGGEQGGQGRCAGGPEVAVGGEAGQEGRARRTAGACLPWLSRWLPLASTSCQPPAPPFLHGRSLRSALSGCRQSAQSTFAPLAAVPPPCS